MSHPELSALPGRNAARRLPMSRRRVPRESRSAQSSPPEYADSSKPVSANRHFGEYSRWSPSWSHASLALMALVLDPAWPPIPLMLWLRVACRLSSCSRSKDRWENMMSEPPAPESSNSHVSITGTSARHWPQSGALSDTRSRLSDRLPSGMLLCLSAPATWLVPVPLPLLRAFPLSESGCICCCICW